LSSTNLLLKSRSDIARAQFYIENNDIFISNLLQYKDPYVKGTTAEYSKVMEFFSLFVKTNPSERINPKDIGTKAQTIIISGATVKIDEKLQVPQSNVTYEIQSFEKKTAILNELEFTEFCFYYPRLNVGGIKAISIEANHVSTPELYFDISKGKEDFNEHKDLSKFVHCLVGKNPRALLYSIGGVENGDAIDKVYLRKDKIFDEIDHLKTARYEFGVATWPNHIAVAGGRGTLEYLMKNNSSMINTIEIFTAGVDGKGTWEEYEAKMSEPKSCCAICFFENTLYVMGGIKECSEEIKLDSLPDILPFNSMSIDVFDINNKTYSKKITITTPLTNSLADCACIPINANEIIVLRDFLFKDEAKDEDIMDCKRMTQNKLTITGDKAVIGHLGASIEADFACINTGYDTCNVLAFKKGEYIMIPDYISHIPAEQEPEVLMFNSKTMAFTSIMMNDPKAPKSHVLVNQSDENEEN